MSKQTNRNANVNYCDEWRWAPSIVLKYMPHETFPTWLLINN